MDYSTVTLYDNVPFDVEYKHTMLFESIAKQNAYFNQQDTMQNPKVHKTVITNSLYVDYNQNIIAIPGSLGSNYNYNYLSFVNADNEKRYYAFITDKNYTNDGTTVISFMIDVMQTFMFDFKVAPTIVEQGHTIRLRKDSNNIIRPNIGVGGVHEQALRKQSSLFLGYAKERKNTNIVNLRKTVTHDSGVTVPEDVQNLDIKWCYIITTEPIGAMNQVKFTNMPGCYILCIPYCVNMTNIEFTYTETGTVYNLFRLDELITSELSGRIAAVIIASYPAFNYTLKYKGSHTSGSRTIYTIDVSGVFYLIKDLAISQSAGLFPEKLYMTNKDLYTATSPKDGTYINAKSFSEKDIFELFDSSTLSFNTSKGSERSIKNEVKLTMYPYSEILLYNNTGELSIKMNEILDKNSYIADSSYKILIKPVGLFSNSYLAYLDGYKTYRNNIENYSLPFTSDCSVPMTNDSFNQYMSQKFGSDAIVSALSVALGAAITMAGAPMAGVPMAVGGYSNLIGNIVGAAEAPDKISKSTDGMTTLCFNADMVKYCVKRLTEPYLQSYFDYFYKYGYEVNQIVNNIYDPSLFNANMANTFVGTRYWFNYVKTNECELKDSSIGNTKFEENIKQIFNNGITFWHYNNGNYMFNSYTLENIERNIATN